MIHPKKFRKKPVVVEAIPWTGTNYDEICKWAKKKFILEYSNEDPDNRILVIDTLEGTMRADGGDWIIKGIKDEFYPCRRDIFEATYEEVK